MSNSPEGVPTDGHDAITKAVGDAITTWSIVEFELCAIFRQVLRAHREDAATAAYYAIRSFEGRLALANAALRAIWNNLPQPIADEWKALHNKCSNKAKKRAELAHSCVLKVSDGAKDTFFLEIFPKMYLETASSHSSERLNAKQVEERTASFSRLALRLSKFEKDLAHHLRQPSASRLLDHNLVDQLRSAGDPTPTET